MALLPALHARVTAFISKPRLFRWVLLGSLALGALKLGNGLVFDDYLFRARAEQGRWAKLLGSRWEFYDYTGDDPSLRSEFREAGLEGWWIPESRTLANHRPLTALVHRVDFGLFAHHVWVMHCVMLALWLLALCALFWVTRELQLTAAVGGGLLFLYALDDAHAFPLGFVTSKHLVIGTALGLCALAAHIRGARTGSRAWTWAQAPLWGLALAASESGTCWVMYAVAWSACLDRRTLRARALGLVPCALAALVWLAWYKSLSHRSEGADVYLTSLSPEYFAAVASRLPVLLAAQVGLVPADVALPLTGWPLAGVVALSVATLTLFAWSSRAIFRASAEARFFAVAAVLSALPLCATFPSDRLLFPVGVGAMGFIATGLFSLSSEVPRAWVGAMLAIHVLVAGALHPVRGALPRVIGSRQADVIASLEAPADFADKTAVIVNAPAGFSCYLMPLFREGLWLPTPDKVRCLGATMKAVEVRRPEAQVLELSVEGGYLDDAFARFGWSSKFPFHPGDVRHVSDMRFVVTEVTDDDRPKVVRVEFDAPLDDAKWSFWALDRGAFRKFELPRVGQRVTLPEAKLGSW